MLKANITSEGKARSRRAPEQRSSRRQSNFQCAAVCGLWQGEPDAISNAGGYAKFRSRSHDAVIRVYDSMDNVIDTHKLAGDGVKRRLQWP
jgi:hypothetical protein